MTTDLAFNHFLSIPWCRVHLSDKAFQPLHQERSARPDNAHTLFGETWHTDNTIPYMLMLYRPPCEEKGQTGEMRGFFTVGTGLNQHPNIFHGGATATILDSAVGALVRTELPNTIPSYTVVLNVTYKKALRPPMTIMTRSWVTKVEGRKTWAHAQVEGGTGEIYATAEVMMVSAKAKL
ncbi:hypothetical protein AYO21_11937 [Fonsecaea monophora]|uniref:Thioesterase domain-containing protein n=1 Tax=Fonsecaea monophora TaxID=254056 RepID=A0A177ERL2_9EURO|nr:hypothetical protein AYO21_11937 [Fonsecaea monophora]KAH0843973.1 hypothetical protein FOPE_09118 [Fonsecaea pedrosoi]OAG33920.1 hypothetical protein AYO21_11937 [Fonsecaea monophora]